ncbi:MAG: divalent-cation tolerance protein CutA [Halothiobacillaceae bacterium]|nr:MAG: divalent-cation tolerance protein CutA [Halothiobacillaceae bacterium]
MPRHCMIITTLPDRATALAAGRALLEARLVACAQIGGPMTSLYLWKDALHAAEEFELRLKTRRSLGPDIEAMLREQHPYELPQITYVPMEGSRDYLEWVDSCLAS